MAKAKSRLHELAARGQSVWFDTLSRDLVHSGELKPEEIGTEIFLLPAAATGRLTSQVPWSQEARYLACSSVSVSMARPMVSSLRRAISASMSAGTV